jgi:DNA replication and repair protein RecF
VLSQRNALLKQFSLNKNFDSVTLDLWDDQLALHGAGILSKRLEFLDEFTPLFNKNFEYITDSSEKVILEYDSSIGEKNYKTALLTALSRDRATEYTSVGIHRDDLEFKLNGNSLKKFASQGQQKSYLLSLKLAQFEFIKKIKNSNPLLLLDDVYDKLDEKRFKKLISLVSGNQFGQVFITDTHTDRIKNLFEEANVYAKIFLVDNQNIKEL